jgi:hypothetical protein
MKTIPLILLLTLPTCLVPAADEIPAHRGKEIYDAAPVKARVVPKQPRRVLIWNTPAHLMDKDPHKGYCIPYGTAALVAIGRKTGAYEPVSAAWRCFAGNMRRFDAIVMNNGPGRGSHRPTRTWRRRLPARRRPGVVEQAAPELLDYVARGGVACAHFPRRERALAR